MAALALPCASVSACAASSIDVPPNSATRRAARVRRLSFVTMTFTIRPRYVCPSRVKVPVLIMFSVTFCTVPAFNRVEPAITSGPVSISIATSAVWPSGDPGVHVSATTTAPAAFAASIAEST